MTIQSTLYELLPFGLLSHIVGSGESTSLLTKYVQTHPVICYADKVYDGWVMKKRFRGCVTGRLSENKMATKVV